MDTLTALLKDPSPEVLALAAAAALAGVLIGWMLKPRTPKAETHAGPPGLDAPPAAEATSPGGFWVYDHLKNTGRCSDRLAAVLGLENPGAAGMAQVTARFTGEAAERLAREADALRAEGRGFNLLLPLDVDGAERLMQVRGVRRTDARRAPLEDAVWFTDVTDFVEAGKILAGQTPETAAENEALRREAAGWRAVFEDLDSAVCVFGPDRRLDFWTPAFSGLFGLTPNDTAGRPAQDHMLDMLRTRRQLPEAPDFTVFKAREAARFGQQARWSEKLLTLPDERMIRARVGPHPAGGLVYAFEDVTERFGSERRARMADTVREAALANLPEAVCVTGSHGRVSLANPGFAATFGLKPEFVDAKPRLPDLVEAMRETIADAETAWEETRERWRAAFAARERSQGRVELADGRTLLYSLTPLPDGGALAAFVDVSAQARVERALRERAEAEAAAAQAKTQFISDVSYELRAPLTAMTGFSELLHGGYHGQLNERQLEYVGAIRDQAKALSAVVSDIIELAAFEAGGTEMETGAVDVHALLAGLLPLTEERARAKGLHMVFDCDPAVGWLRGDEKRLRHALFHVLSNAVRFTPERGAVRISAGREGGWVSVAVADDGVGVPQDERVQVFDPFVHASNAPPGTRGPGLGLALVRQVARLHGGDCAITANAARGATVTLRLPAADGGDVRTAFQPAQEAEEHGA
ncbi:MAG: sensor histidine kinase [Rhodospirillales bacterium]